MFFEIGIPNKECSYFHILIRSKSISSPHLSATPIETEELYPGLKGSLPSISKPASKSKFFYQK